MTAHRNIDQMVNHLFRHESGKMVSVLVKIFGSSNFELAEDVVQDALIKALETWKYKGIPENPKAWLYRVARNRAIDLIRKNKHSNVIDFTDPKRQLLASEYTLSNTMNSYWKEQHVQDDFLGMMYACCHPEISEENQITFILKSLCGFSTKEVAKAFLTSEDTISKRLYRTKEYFRKHNLRPELPSNDQLTLRTSAVLNAIYLLFNEGYSSTHSEDLIRKDLISQALHLCKSLLNSKRTRFPEVYALMSLMCFHTARSEGRITTEGEIIILSQQDRSTWNKELIAHGKAYLHKAGRGDTFSTYHLEAAIAMEHCIAQTYEDTNWKFILSYYDKMLAVANDPIVALNRCLVLLELYGAEAALEAVQALKGNTTLENYYLYHASLGEIFQKLQQNSQALTHYQIAERLTKSRREQQFLQKKIAGILN